MPAENAGWAFSLVFVDELARRGVRHAVIAPGSRSTPVALAFLEHPKITVHVRVDERSAAYLALGIAKATGAVVPVLCTSGTATTYFHAAVMEADLARVPLLALTADRPPELHGIGANQTVEQSGLYGNAVRWSYDVPAPAAHPDAVDAWRETVRTAVERCLGLPNDPAGPVHLNLALREPLIPIDDGIGFDYDLGLERVRDLSIAKPAPDTTPDALAAALTGARNAVVVVGDAVEDYEPIVRWCERVGWPLIAEPHSNARRGGSALRAADALLRDAAFVDAHRPDLVVVVGRIGLSRQALSWLQDTPHVVVSPDGGNWDVTRSARSVLHCSPFTFERLEAASHQADEGWQTAWTDASQRVSHAIDEVLDSTDALTEPRVARDVARLLRSGAVLVVASSMPIRDLDLVMEPRDDITVYANRGVSGIDGFVSSAQGVAIGNDGDPTVALCGDLSLLHDSNGFIRGAEAQPDLTYVVINNDGGGIFSLLPQGDAVEPAAFERLFGTPHGVSLEALAAAYGVAHQLVSSAGELADALSTFDGLRIVEVRTDRAENAELHARLREITAGTA
ncbi:MAG TPA: 2-succinyl-5-enolpyruvyl-6-hydroxy-3-cyclohexene-1-carboxylic-acid synthase [Mycobacteriales bacterium]|nr:2-succinyl-5-enolpyruvyl-6-hydroxy-3-cyclohexene-1-carboxylic-acid synthase [Mycobacteriales bacterium]